MAQFAGRRCGRPPPRWFCLLLLALVAVVLTAAVLAFLVHLLGGAKGTPAVRVCHTHECHEYGRRLGSSLNQSVRPCDSFTQFVCDGWRRENEFSTYELLVAQGLESVTRTLDALNVPQTGQSSAQRGAALYRSCEKLLYGERDDLAAVREALGEAGITWPRRPARADVLHTVLVTSLRLGWDVLFRFVSLRSPQARLAVNSGRTIVLILNRNKMALELALRGTRRGYFSMLRSSMLPPQVTQRHETATVADEVSFQEVTAIEELTLPMLSEAYYMPSASPESAYHMSDIPELGPLGLSRARWLAALRKFGLGDVTEFVTANPEYVRTFLDLWNRLGENTTHIFVSWCTVQVAALLANQNLIVNFYDGNSRRALSLHVAFCLGLAYAVSGPVLFSGYNRHILKTTVRQDASRLLLGVREFFRKRLVRWRGYDMNTTVVGQWSSLDVVFRELGNGDRTKTGDAVGGSGSRPSGAAENTTGGGVVPDLTEDSLVANLRKVSSPVAKGVRDDDARGDAEESAVSVSISVMRLLAVSRANRDFTLVPYALSFPHFDDHLPAAVNYGGLGAEVARALGVLVSNAYRSHPTSRVWLEDLAHCLSTSPFADGVGVDVAEALSLGALVDAYEDVRADVAAAKLPGLESYTDLQLLFMALCFAKCRGSGARKTPLWACNLPLMYSPQFARAFGCAVGTPMNQLNQCPTM
nr:endothelin-converting enzyme 2-like [Dermacentor andersoni]